MTNIHTIVPTSNLSTEFFSSKNIEFLQQKIAEILLNDYNQRIVYSEEDVIKEMVKVFEEKPEKLGFLNERTVLGLVREFRAYQIETKKHLNLEEHYISSQSLYDVSSNRGPDMFGIKLKERYRRDRVGGTLNFHFT